MIRKLFQRRNEQLTERASRTNEGFFEDGWIAEDEEAAWDHVRQEQEDYFETLGRHDRKALIFKDFAEVKDELIEAGKNRLRPKTPWEIERTLSNPVLKMRNQPTGDCVGNAYSRAMEALILDMISQKYEVNPRPVHPSYIYGGARMLAGSRRGAGANVALAAAFVHQHGVLFEDASGIKSYDTDRQMSDRLGSKWDSPEMKEYIETASSFRVSAIKIPSRNPLPAINICLDAGAKIAGGFRAKFVSGEIRNGVKFGRLQGTWNHAVSLLGRVSEVDAYLWANSHGNRYPGTCALGTPAWAINLNTENTSRMCEGASLYALWFVQIAGNNALPNWSPLG